MKKFVAMILVVVMMTGFAYGEITKVTMDENMDGTCEEVVLYPYSIEELEQYIECGRYELTRERTAGDVIGDFDKMVVDSAIEWVEGAYEDTRDFVSNAGDTIASSATTAANWTAKTAESAWNSTTEWIGSIF